MKKIVPTLVFVGLAAVLLLLVQRIDSLHQENQSIMATLSQVRAQQSDLAKSLKSLKLGSVQIKESPQVIPMPSKNPAKDVTGASARIFKRTASQNQCARVCSTMVHCLSTSSLCPNIGTGSTREATQRCAQICAEDKGTRQTLMNMTDCPHALVPDVPAPLRNICIDSH